MLAAKSVGGECSGQKIEFTSLTLLAIRGVHGVRSLGAEKGDGVFVTLHSETMSTNCLYPSLVLCLQSTVRGEQPRHLERLLFRKNY
jgi:hypothetical protein